MPSDATTTSLKPALCVLLLLTALHLAFSYLSYHLPTISDELLYQLMALRMEEVGNPASKLAYVLDNGFFKTQHPLLRFSTTLKIHGYLVAQYPPLFALVLLPFTLLFGHDGIFVFNALALLAVALCTSALAQECFKNRLLSLQSAILLLGCTPLWWFSQTAFSHMGALAFSLAGYTLLLHGCKQACTLSAFGAGLLLGVAVGIRLDAVYLAAVALFCLLSQRDVRARIYVATAAGFAPVLLVIAIINQARFGQFTPFTYGNTELTHPVFNTVSYQPAAGLFLLCIAGIITRRFVPMGMRGLIYSLLALGGLIVFYELFLQLLGNLGWAVLDGYHTENVRPGASLLQLFPAFAALLWPVIALFRRQVDGARFLWLLIPSIAYILAYAYMGALESLSLQGRYFLPAYPFACILIAWCWHQVCSFRRQHGLSFIGLAAPAFFMAGLYASHGHTLVISNDTLRFVPLALAATCAFAMLCLAFGKRQLFMARAAQLAILLALIFTSFVQFGIVTPGLEKTRLRHAAALAAVSPHIPPKSLVIFSEMTEPFFALAARGDIHFALVREPSDAARIESLAVPYLRRHQPVFVIARRSFFNMHLSDWRKIFITQFAGNKGRFQLVRIRKR